MAAEGSLELLGEASTERDAEYTAAGKFGATLAEHYLAAERALRVSTQIVTQSDVRSAEEVEATKSSALGQKQQPLQQQEVQQQQFEPVAVGAVELNFGRRGAGCGDQQLDGVDKEVGVAAERVVQSRHRVDQNMSCHLFD